MFIGQLSISYDSVGSMDHGNYKSHVVNGFNTLLQMQTVDEYDFTSTNH
jgi:hypothetical protein